MAKQTGTKKAAARRAKPGIFEVLARPGITPEELFKLDLIPVSLNGIYDACRRGEIESFRVGRKIVIPTAPLKRKFQIEAA